MLARAAQCHPPCTVCRHAWRSQRLGCHSPRLTSTGPRSSCRQTTAPQAVPGDSQELGGLSEEILRRQQIIEEQLAELKEITARLTSEEQRDLVEAIKQKDADAERQGEQAGEPDYPQPVRDILEAAGVLDALPFDPEPVLAGGSGEALPRPLSYEWSNEDFVDDGQQLTDEDWSEFFQTQLDNIRKEAAGNDEGSGRSDDEPDDPFHGLPDPFDDELSLPGDDIPFEPGEGVEEMLQLLEAGQPLPPDPRQMGRPKESAQSFLRRMDKLQARYDAQFFKRKDWQISPEEVKALDAQWEEVAMRSDVPITTDDIQEVTPAPDIPPEVERQFQRLEWVTYRLRRAYLEGTPSQPVQALASAGLLAADVIYRDIVMECRGLPAVMSSANVRDTSIGQSPDYLSAFPRPLFSRNQRTDWTHGSVELCQIWGHMSEHRPVPEWYVMVDSWLNIPYPDWYLEYVRVHFQPALFPDAFMAAFSNAAQSDDAHLEKVLEQYRQWGEVARGVPRNRRERKRMERPVLWRDAYADRPFTNQQRRRSGTLPVLERNPGLTIDDTDALGTPEDMLKDPFLDTRASDFVTNPARGQPRFAGLADDPYGSGRHLLLPMFRRMQHAGSRIISLARGNQHSTAAARLQQASSAAAQDAAPASSRLSSSASYHSAPAVTGPAGRSIAPELHAGAVASGAAAELALPPEQSNVDTQGASAETPPEGTGQSAAKHRIRIEGALQASHTMARDWAAGRLSLDYPPAEDGDVGSVRSEPMPSQDSMQGSSSAAVLLSVLSSLRQVQPGILVSTQLPTGLDAATLEELSSRQRGGDDTAAEALAALRCRGVFAGRERPKPELPKPWQQTLAAAAGRPFHFDAPSQTMQPPLEPWRSACQVARPAGSAPAAASDAPPSAAAPDAARPAETSAAPARHLSRARPRLHPVALWHSWHLRRKKARSRTLEAMKALPPLKAMRAALLPAAPGSAHSSTTHLRHVDAVLEGVSSFAGGPRSKGEQDHTFRLLAYAPIAQAVTHARIQQASSAEAAGAGNPMADQHRSSIQHRQPASHSKGADTEPVPSQEQTSGPPRRLPSTGKRLSFQVGSGYAADTTSSPGQQGSVPDLIGLMCSASSGSAEAEVNLPAETHARGAREAEMSGTADIPQDSVRSKEKMAGKAGTAPRKRPLGTAWRDGSHMTIPMTTMYELNPATGQVDRITSHWNGYIMHGLGGAEQEAWDIYMRQTRLFELRGRPGCSVRYIRRSMKPTDPDAALDL